MKELERYDALDIYHNYRKPGQVVFADDHDKYVAELEGKVHLQQVVIAGAEALAEEHGCDAVVGFIAQHLKETNK